MIRQPIGRYVVVVLAVIAALSRGSDAASQNSAVSRQLAGAVTVHMIDSQGAPLRSVNGTMLNEGVVIPSSALSGASSAQIIARDGSRWESSHLLAVHSPVGIALLQMPEPAPFAIVFPGSGAFMPGSRATLLAGPGGAADSVTTTLQRAFSLRDGTDFIPVKPGLAGAAPCIAPDGRFLGVSGDLSEDGFSLGYVVPMASVRAVVNTRGAPMPISVAAGEDTSAPLENRTSSYGLSFRGAILHTMGDSDDARNFLTLALKVDPDSPNAHFWMGHVYFRESEYIRAAESFIRAGESDKTYHLAWHMAGAAYNQAGQFLDSEEMYTKALEIDPNSAMTLCNLGGAYVNQRRHELAIEAFNKSIRADPRYQNGLAYLNLAMTYDALGRRAEAEQVYQDLLKISPSAAAQLRTQLDRTR